MNPVLILDPDVMKEMRSLPARKVRRTNLDVSAAVSMALALVCALRPHTAALEKKFLEEFHGCMLRRLERTATALEHCEVRLLFVRRGSYPSPGAYTEGIALRRRLRGVARMLCDRGVLSRALFRDCRSRTDFRHVARDLQVLSMTLRGVLPEIPASCPIDRADLARAEQLSLALLPRYSKEQVKQVTEARDRVFTLMTKAYGELRRFLRAHIQNKRDADLLVPSLWRTRS